MTTDLEMAKAAGMAEGAATGLNSHKEPHMYEMYTMQSVYPPENDLFSEVSSFRELESAKT